MSKRIVIGLCGVAGAGKSTAAKAIVMQRGFVRRPFAWPLKSMIAALGVDRDVLDGPTGLKEKPMDLFGGKTLRHAMQTLGTEWGRHNFGDDFWTRMWLRGVDRLGHMVADDVRYPSEEAAVRSIGGILIRIDRLGAGSNVSASHSSEDVDQLSPDACIANNGTIDDMVVRIMDEIERKQWAA